MLARVSGGASTWWLFSPLPILLPCTAVLVYTGRMCSRLCGWRACANQRMFIDCRPRLKVMNFLQQTNFTNIFPVAYVLMAPSLLSGCCQEIPSTFLKIDGGCAIPGDCSLFLKYHLIPRLTTSFPARWLLGVPARII